MGIGFSNPPCTYTLLTRSMHTHSYRLVSFILFFGRGWASAFPTRHASKNTVLIRSCVVACTHIHTGLCPVFSSSEGDGHRLFQPAMHAHSTNIRTRAHTCIQACVLHSLCPLFFSSEGDGHRLFQPAMHAHSTNIRIRAHACIQACVLYSFLRRGMGIGFTLLIRSMHTHSYRLVSFILFFGGGWASASPTRHARTLY
jgi:hypothetical protein